MKNPAPYLTIGLLAFSLFSEASFAQLPTKSELVVKKYEEDRAKGITALNKRYIAAFEKELDLALAAKELEEANAIQKKIESLKAEIEGMSDSPVASLSSTEKITIDPDFLVGKTLGIPFDHDPTKTAYFSFHADGQAYWLGLKNQKVDRAYKPTGKDREFHLWWPERGDDYGASIVKIAPDGKTATVTNQSTNKVVDGIIEDAD